MFQVDVGRVDPEHQPARRGADGLHLPIDRAQERVGVAGVHQRHFVPLVIKHGQGHRDELSLHPAGAEAAIERPHRRRGSRFGGPFL